MTLLETSNWTASRASVVVLGEQFRSVGDKVPVHDIFGEGGRLQGRDGISWNFQDGVILGELQIDVDPLFVLWQFIERRVVLQFTDLAINGRRGRLVPDEGKAEDLLAASVRYGIGQGRRIPIVADKKRHVVLAAGLIHLGIVGVSLTEDLEEPGVAGQPFRGQAVD